MSYPVSRYPIPQLEDLPLDIAAQLQTVQDKAGFIPNVYLTLAYRPDEFRSFFSYHDAIMLRQGRLSKAEKEMIVVATSAANDCSYCVIAHGALLRIYAKNPLLADQIAISYQNADIMPRQKAMLNFAVKLATSPAEVQEADYIELQEQGFSAEDIWDIGSIVAFFGLSNRMAHLTGMRPNDEFYLMGRVPRQPETTSASPVPAVPPVQPSVT